VEIERIQPGLEWDQFVDRHPGAALGHVSAWADVLQDAYGLEPVYLVARERKALIGVLPLARFKTVRGRRESISLPFLDSAGPLARDAGTERRIVEAATRNWGPIELRQARRPLSREVVETNRVNLSLALGGGPEARWAALPGKVRNQTRKAEREGLVLAGPDRDLLDDFYRVHRANMHALGSPVHSRRFFAAVLERFAGRARVFVALHRHRPVGGLIALEGPDGVSVPWASTLLEARPLCPNNLIYWEAIRWAEERGARQFGFGRSPRGGPTHRFKVGWGASEAPLYWYRVYEDGRTQGAHSTADSRWLAPFARIWRELPPSVCDRLGPVLRQRIAS